MQVLIKLLIFPCLLHFTNTVIYFNEELLRRVILIICEHFPLYMIRNVKVLKAILETFQPFPTTDSVISEQLDSLVNKIKNTTYPDQFDQLALILTLLSYSAGSFLMVK